MSEILTATDLKRKEKEFYESSELKEKIAKITKLMDEARDILFEPLKKHYENSVTFGHSIMRTTVNDDGTINIDVDKVTYER